MIFNENVGDKSINTATSSTTAESASTTSTADADASAATAAVDSKSVPIASLTSSTSTDVTSPTGYNFNSIRFMYRSINQFNDCLGYFDEKTGIITASKVTTTRDPIVGKLTGNFPHLVLLSLFVFRLFLIFIVSQCA